jgi:ATP-dependent protease ClpP protease subunit
MTQKVIEPRFRPGQYSAFSGTGTAAPWFTAKAVSQDVAAVTIDKVIGSDWLPDWFNEEAGMQSARAFIDAIEALGDLKEIRLELNSPGGDVYAGIRIYNYLKNHKARVNITVTGIAASIASVVLMAGDRREMAIGTTAMVHNPYAFLAGAYNQKELTETLEALAKIQGSMVEIYARATGKPKAKLVDLLDQGDTYLGAEEALQWGFATHINGKASGQATAQARAFWQDQRAQAGIRQNSRSRAPAQQLKRSSLDPLLASAGNPPDRREVYDQLNNPVAASWDAAFNRCR